MSLRIARALVGRGAPVVRAPAVASFHTSKTTRKVVNTGDTKDDLGGPGGQDPPPRRSNWTQDWPSIAAMGGVAVVVGGGVVYFTSNPKKAEKARQKTRDVQAHIGDKAEEAKGYVKDKAKEAEAEAKRYGK